MPLTVLVARRLTPVPAQAGRRGVEVVAVRVAGFVLSEDEPAG